MTFRDRSPHCVVFRLQPVTSTAWGLQPHLTGASSIEGTERESERQRQRETPLTESRPEPGATKAQLSIPRLETKSANKNSMSLIHTSRTRSQERALTTAREVHHQLPAPSQQA